MHEVQFDFIYSQVKQGAFNNKKFNYNNNCNNFFIKTTFAKSTTSISYYITKLARTI